MKQLDLSVIILTYNEEIHICRCLENIRSIAKQIYVIDSFSTDSTATIAKSFGAEVIQHKWPGNQAEQFNWALDNLHISTEWILRLDADEYLLPDLINELALKLDTIPSSVAGVEFSRRHIFLNRWVKRGTYPVNILRLFRTGKGRSEYRIMDEHIVLLEGETCLFDNDFVDHNLNSLDWWISKHINYSIREAVEFLDVKYSITSKREKEKVSKNLRNKRSYKDKYNSSPLFIRSFAYFIYRYVVKLGFLEGKEGFLWHFLQGWWYRTLVDAKIMEITNACGDDVCKIKKYIRDKYNIIIK